MVKGLTTQKAEIGISDVKFRLYPLSISFKNNLPADNNYFIELEKGNRLSNI